MNVQRDQKKIEQQATTQLTTITSLLAGFGFTGFTLLLTIVKEGKFFRVVFVSTAVTIFILVAASISGAILNIATEIKERTGNLNKAENIWLALSIIGIVLFIADVALFTFLLSNIIGIICSVLALATIIGVFWLWLYIGESVKS
jgi:hypothetical protein